MTIFTVSKVKNNMKKFIVICIIGCFPYILLSQNYVVDTLLNGMNMPVEFAFIPNSSKVIVTLKASSAVIYDINTGNQVSTFWTFTDSLTSCGERGVLGVCIDPDYITNHYIYIYYVHSNPPNTSTNMKMRIVRFTENNNIGTNPLVVFNHPETSSSCFHYGGVIRFRPSEPGKIYLVIGARTPADAQTLANPRGKVLRVNKDGTIPEDNPFYDDGNPFTGNDDRIWAYGFRNSFGICFGPNDSLYQTDNGEMNYDECNIVIKGKNYGGGICEGYCVPYNPAYKNPMIQLGIPQPVSQLPALTGLMVYTASQMPWLTGKLIVASNNNNSVAALYKCDFNAANDSIVSSSVLLNLKELTTVLQGIDGNIYALNGGFTASGKLFRIKPDPTGINNENLYSGFSLSQNYPNPFNPVTKIKYEISMSSFVTTRIFDVMGNEIYSQNEGKQQPGSYEVSWDGANFPSGVYFYELSAGEFRERKKMVLLK